MNYDIFIILSTTVQLKMFFILNTHILNYHKVFNFKKETFFNTKPKH